MDKTIKTPKIGDWFRNKEDASITGFIVSFSDDGSTIYYKHYDGELFYSSTTVSKIEIVRAQ
jgi:hypothetical protein